MGIPVSDTIRAGLDDVMILCEFTYVLLFEVGLASAFSGEFRSLDGSSVSGYSKSLSVSSSVIPRRPIKSRVG